METIKSNSNQKYLVIILHGYRGSPESMSHIEKQVRLVYKNSTVLIPRLPLHLFSNADPLKITKHIVTLIDKECSKADNCIDHIILIGHSCGALLARKVYVYACGENADARFSYSSDVLSSTYCWASKIERIILLAGMNKGWSLVPHLSFRESILMGIGITLGNLLIALKYYPMIFRVRKGASFITQLRLQWLSLQNHAKTKNVGNAIVIQLLGTIDNLVSPDDNIDLITGSSFYYLDVPHSGHFDVLQMDQTTYGIERSKVFIDALSLNQLELEALQIDSLEQSPIKQKPEVTDVVFVIHGIRDTGFWTKKIARKIQKLGLQQNRIFETETSSYGYFSMASFLLFSGRRTKVEWLMDQYTENKALFPNAKFSFVGHSNGTYLLARALKDYPSCNFENVVFAGSVVRKDYNWRKLIKEHRVKRVLNYIATSDAVVAIFPNSFQILKLQDLGSGGHEGFNDLHEQIRFIKGGHSAALKEEMWNHIAEFIVNGIIGTIEEPILQTKQSKLTKFLGLTAPIIILIILFIVMGIGIGLSWFLGCHEPQRTLAILLYIFCLWKILTRL